jgi:hypothetical protein
MYLISLKQKVKRASVARVEATLMVSVNVILAEFVALQPVVVSVEVEVVRVDLLAGGLPVVQFIVHKNNLL